MRTRIKTDDMLFLVKIVFFDFVQKIIQDRFLKGEFKLDSENIPDEKLTPEYLEELVDKKISEMDIPIFKYQNLKDQVESYELTKTCFFDTSIHNIEGFLVDVYRTYCELQQNIDKMNSEYLGDDDFSKYLKDGMKRMIEGSFRLKVLFSDIVLYHQFEETEIRGIQYNFLKDLLGETIQDEDYERSALIRDKLNFFFI